MLDLSRERNNMLNINFEFRKGIFFIRLIGDFTKDTIIDKLKNIKALIEYHKFKYIVINTNYISHIDIDGVGYLNELLLSNHDTYIVLCDKFNIYNSILNLNIPNIVDEGEIL